MERSLRKLKEDGWCREKSEYWNPFADVRHDLFGFIDILCCAPGRGFLAVQTGDGNALSEHIKKIINEPRAAVWIASGGRIVIHAWREMGKHNRKKVWRCREVEITKEDFPKRNWPKTGFQTDLGFDAIKPETHKKPMKSRRK